MFSNRSVLFLCFLQSSVLTKINNFHCLSIFFCFLLICICLYVLLNCFFSISVFVIGWLIVCTGWICCWFSCVWLPLLFTEINFQLKRKAFHLVCFLLFSPFNNLGAIGFLSVWSYFFAFNPLFFISRQLSLIKYQCIDQRDFSLFPLTPLFLLVSVLFGSFPTKISVGIGDSVSAVFGSGFHLYSIGNKSYGGFASFCFVLLSFTSLFQRSLCLSLFLIILTGLVELFSSNDNICLVLSFFTFDYVKWS